MDILLFPDYVRELNMCSVVLRIISCIICGGAVGIERQWRHRTAGFKTHILVCMGATICMITGQYAFLYFGATGIDPTRIGAQVVSGIGFLGVGTIIVTKDNKVKGLTTAAGLWVSACIGLAIGIGFFEIAFLATVCVVALFLLVKYLGRIGVERGVRMYVYVELSDVSYVKEFLNYIKEQHGRVVKMETQTSRIGYGGGISIILGVQGDEELCEAMNAQIIQLPYVSFYEEMDTVEID